MRYMSHKNIEQIGIDWGASIKVIEQAITCIKNGDFAQPIKPYLRYKNMKNRIIAMPGFLGNGINMAGIKWIASFPENVKKDLPRAHCVVVLNESDTGIPLSIINTPLISIIRTAAVSGYLINKFIEARNKKDLSVGIIGWGPIGQYHYKMCRALLEKKIDKFYLFDLKGIDPHHFSESEKESIAICETWKDVFEKTDIFITCTVSDNRYINSPPKKSSLYLNVSLRDFSEGMYDYFKNAIIVDNWEEVCRENTDIELMHKCKGLCKEEVYEITDVMDGIIGKIPLEQPIMFNPMGMAVFDIAIATYYYKKSLAAGIGTELE
jgi:2,3-diaminopropionate biosynthesis protein SbnB